MDEADIIARSLELVAERAGDPAAEVYARLFAEFPDAEARFARDVSGAVRGEMLAQVLECLMSADGPYQLNLVRAERVNHDGFGTPSDQFDRFFGLVHETCRELAGDAWTEAFDAAWRRRIAQVRAETR